MGDEKGGWKGANTALLREHLHAATMFGRMAAAHEAVRLGYGIERDDGPSGKLGHWRIAGIPEEVMAVHSKRGRRSKPRWTVSATPPGGPRASWPETPGPTSATSPSATS